MFTHLYQRQHFKEAEVRVYAGEIVLALEHLHQVGEGLATRLPPWALAWAFFRVSLSGLPGGTGDCGCFPRPPGREASALPRGVSSPGAPFKEPSSPGARGCLLGPRSQNYLKWGPRALASKAFLK